MYQVEGELNEDDKFEKYDGVYYDFVKDDFVYSVGPIKNQNKIKELNLIFEKNNITPEKIKTDNQFYK